MPNHRGKPENILIHSLHDGSYIVRTHVGFNGHSYAGKDDLTFPDFTALSAWMKAQLDI